MICYELKGGTGTPSRRLEVEGSPFTLGVLVRANHGLRPRLAVTGRPVGEVMTENRVADMVTERGSIVVILATDLPLLPGQLERIARSAAIGIGRGGTPGGNTSGDIFLAFATANEMPLPQLPGAWRQMTCRNDELLDPVYLAAVEAVDEAELNALCAARDVPLARPANGICRAMDTHRLMSLLRR